MCYRTLGASCIMLLCGHVHIAGQRVQLACDTQIQGLVLPLAPYPPEKQTQHSCTLTTVEPVWVVSAANTPVGAPVKSSHLSVTYCPLPTGTPTYARQLKRVCYGSSAAHSQPPSTHSPAPLAQDGR